MAKLLRISDGASLALHTMALLASVKAGRLSAREIADRLAASRAHLSKVLQRLARAGLVWSVRGPRGGFSLARPAEEVTLLDVYEAIDGPLDDSTCLLGAPVCSGKNCLLGDLVEAVNLHVRVRLAGTRLRDVAGHLTIPRPGSGEGRGRLSGQADRRPSRKRARPRRQEGGRGAR